MSVGLVEDSPGMIRRLWPRTRGAWGVVVLVVLAFFVLDVLALMGSDLATDLLIFSAGTLVGAGVGYAAAYPLRDRFASSGDWRMIGIILGLASVAGIILLGSSLADIPVFPTAEGGNAGDVIYGLAFGFGACFMSGLGPSRRTVPRTHGRDGSLELRLLFVTAGAVGALFALAFAAYVVFEYVVGPIVRYFA